MTFLNNQKIAIVIPAFNESQTIVEVVQGVISYADCVVVVDDGSSDETAREAEKAGAVVITHENNQGYDSSVEDGFKEAVRRGADILITVDADGQHRLQDIRKISDLIITRQADVVVGQRDEIPHLGEKIFAFYTRMRFGIRDPLCGLKAYRRNVYETVGHFDTLHSVGTQLMLEALQQGFRVKLIPVTVLPRRGTRSRFFSFRIGKGIGR